MKDSKYEHFRNSIEINSPEFTETPFNWDRTAKGVNHYPNRQKKLTILCSLHDIKRMNSKRARQYSYISVFYNFTRLHKKGRFKVQLIGSIMLGKGRVSTDF